MICRLPFETYVDTIADEVLFESLNSLLSETTKKLFLEAPRAYNMKFNNLLMNLVPSFCQKEITIVLFEGHHRKDMSETIDVTRLVGCWFTSVLLYLSCEENLSQNSNIGVEDIVLQRTFLCFVVSVWEYSWPNVRSVDSF